MKTNNIDIGNIESALKEFTKNLHSEFQEQVVNEKRNEFKHRFERLEFEAILNKQQYNS